MKFSMLTIAGALAAANAASTRGDAARSLKTMALMQKVTDELNKKAFGGFDRRLQDEDNMNYEYNQEEITAETIIQPYMCVTATVYNGNNNANNDANENNANAYAYSSAKPTISYLSFVGATDADNNGYEYLYGNNDEYMTTLSAYLQAVGTSWAEEKAELCEDCEMLENFCEMDYDERQYFANMSEEEFEEFIQEMEQKAQEKNQQQEEEKEQDQQSAYAAYSYGNGGRGRRHLFQSLGTICNTCDEMCADDEQIEQSQEYYEEIVKLFEESMCVESGNGNYIGHTCGSDGRSIELALFSDENCMYMAGEQNAYSLYQQAVAQVYGDGDADNDGEQDYDWNPDDLALGYMQMVTEMFSDEYSCQVGAVRSFDGSDPSEACENLYGNAVSKSECVANMYNNAEENADAEENANQNQYQQYEYNGNGNANGNNYLPEGYDMVYSENIEDVCATVLQLEANLANREWSNPFAGDTFQKLFGNQNGLSGGAIAGIVIAVIAAIAAAATVFKKKTETKTDLEEPVFQGGDLS